MKKRSPKKITAQKAVFHLSWKWGGVGVVLGIVLLSLIYTAYSAWVSREWLRPTTQFDVLE